jgi:hypothetical protein
MSNNNFAISNWDNEYARLARLASQYRSNINITNNNKNNNSNNDVNKLQQEVRILESSLNTIQHLVSSSEIQRRKWLVQHLLQQISNTMNNNNNNNNLGGGGGLGSVGGGQSSSSYQPPQQQSIQTQMQMALQQQDNMIDDLAVGMDRLKNQTVAIGDEARLHVNLLNDMESNLDAAHDSLESQTRRAAKLREDQSIWRLQLIVAALFILLILLIFLGLTP